jgi:CBS domain-containing protein
MAYEILMRIRAMEGLARGTSGRYVHIKELNKLERQTHRNTFSVVKDVQLMLTSRYRIDFLR